MGITVKLIAISVLVFVGCAQSDDCFRAAVYQHYPANKSLGDTSLIINANLEIYEEIAAIAAQEGAKVLAFPEDGILNPTEFARKVIVEQFAERIPDARKGRFNPCENEDEYRDRPITYRLSCLAKNNNLYVAAAYADRIDCDGQSDLDCPSDGFYSYNTAVAFGPDGTLEAKYHKMQPFHEYYHNVPTEPDFAYFDTPYGRMGLFICYDIAFREPGISLVNKYGVTSMIFVTWWYDELPFRSALQTQESWAVTNRVNVLASNIIIPETSSIGGGIYSAESGHIIASDIHDSRPVLLIADIPIDGNQEANCLRNRYTKAIHKPGFTRSLPEYKPLFRLELNDAAIVSLEKPSDSLNVCSNDFCCRLEYSTNSAVDFSQDNYRLIVANRFGHALQQVKYPECQEICGIFRCDDENCENFSINTNQVFEKLEISAKFGTNYTYPSVSSDGLKLVPKHNWVYENDGRVGSQVKLRLNDFNEPILTFGLFGRCYDRDYPYRQ